MRMNSKSIENFAVMLLRDAFTLEELTDPNTNLNGTNAKGSRGPLKQPLDPARMVDIHEIMRGFIAGNEKTKANAWTSIKQAFNKELSNLKSKRRS